MSDEVIDTQDSQPVDNQPVEQADNQTAETGITIPDELKFRQEDGKEPELKGWVKKVTSEDGKVDIDALLRQVDNLDALAGKKGFELATATDEELSAHLQSLRPQDPKEYAIEGVAETEEISNMLYKHNLHKSQADGLVKDYLQYEQAQIARHYSEDGFKEELRGIFGDKYEEQAGKVRDIIKNTVKDPELLDYIDKKVPNRTLGVMYKLVDKLVKDYLPNDGSSALQSKAGMAAGNLTSLQKEVDDSYNALFELKGKPGVTADQHSTALKRYINAQAKLRQAKGTQ